MVYRNSGVPSLEKLLLFEGSKFRCTIKFNTTLFSSVFSVSLTKRPQTSNFKCSFSKTRFETTAKRAALLNKKPMLSVL